MQISFSGVVDGRGWCDQQMTGMKTNRRLKSL